MKQCNKICCIGLLLFFSKWTLLAEAKTIENKKIEIFVGGRHYESIEKYTSGRLEANKIFNEMLVVLKVYRVVFASVPISSSDDSSKIKTIIIAPKP